MAHQDNCFFAKSNPYIMVDSETGSSGQREVKDAYNYTFSRPIGTINNNPSVYTNPNQQQYNQFFSYGSYHGSEIIPNQSGALLSGRQDEVIHQSDYIVPLPSNDIEVSTSNQNADLHQYYYSKAPGSYQADSVCYTRCNSNTELSDTNNYDDDDDDDDDDNDGEDEDEDEVGQHSGGNHDENDDDNDDDYDDDDDDDHVADSNCNDGNDGLISPSHLQVNQHGNTSGLDQSFRCDRCNSPYVVDPNRRGNRKKQTKHMPCPRRKRDPQTNKILTLCNACGLAFNRCKRMKASPSPPSLELKLEYQQEAKQFTLHLIKKFGDQDAERLSCPNFKKHGCGCLQKYITGQNPKESENRVVQLLSLIKQAKILRQQKCYGLPNSDGINGNPAKSKIKVGLGNGHRKSKEFEEFVLTHRKILREEYNLCERATQKILIYSNNFLHKKLKTDPNQRSRITRRKGKAALGKLKPISELANENCCIDNCIKIAKTHAKLLQEWRDRATSGQEEARRVLAEMLTPAGGSRTNCYRFISWITGCSHSTISRVNEQMKKTGGSREPPQHGLKQWWKKYGQPRKSSNRTQSTSDENLDKTTKPINYSQSYYQQDFYSASAVIKTENTLINNQHSQAIINANLLADSPQYEQDSQKMMDINSQWNNFTSQQVNMIDSRNRYYNNTHTMQNMTPDPTVCNMPSSNQYHNQQLAINESTQLLHSSANTNNQQYNNY